MPDPIPTPAVERLHELALLAHHTHPEFTMKTYYTFKEKCYPADIAAICRELLERRKATEAEAGRELPNGNV